MFVLRGQDRGVLLDVPQDLIQSNFSSGYSWCSRLPHLSGFGLALATCDQFAEVFPIAEIVAALLRRFGWTQSPFRHVIRALSGRVRIVLNKRIQNLQALVDHQAVVHVFRPERRAARFQRRSHH